MNRLNKVKHIIYIGNILSRHGNTPTNIETLGPLLEKEGYNITYASSKKNPLLRLFDMAFTIFKNKKQAGVVLIDTYSTNAFYFAWLSSRICYLLKIPYLPILHGGNLPQRIKKSPKLSKQIFGNSRCNIIISEYLKQSLIDNNFFYTTIPNNINLAEYPFLKRSKINPDILWVRSFHSIYNPTMAIKVLNLLKKTYPAAKLTMVGPDKDGTLAMCKNLAKELNLENDIQFAGKLKKEDWLKLSANFGIFINTTNFDNLPVSVIEAQALGMPVVSTNVGGIPFLIQNEVNGLLVNPDNENEMVIKIIELLNNSELTLKLSENAREAAENFDWKIIKEKWNVLLQPFIKE